MNIAYARSILLRTGAFIAIAGGLLLSGCASRSPDTVKPTYHYAYIDEAQVDSTDTDEGESNEAMRAYIGEQLTKYVTNEGMEVVQSKEPRDGLAILESTLNVSWGNRALRWVSLGGAGEGVAKLKIAAKDSKTGKVVVEKSAEETRRWGFIAGGSMTSKAEGLVRDIAGDIAEELAAYRDR